MRVKRRSTAPPAPIIGPDGTIVRRRRGRPPASASASAPPAPPVEPRPKPIIRSVVGRDGVRYRLNDCVYLEPEDPHEMYYIGQILEFSAYKRNVINPDKITIKVCWYFRASEMFLGTPFETKDAKLLVCTMQTDYNKVSDIRGLCTIRERGTITNFEEYRQEPDCFYFENIYNIWTRRVYDIVPRANVANLPQCMANYTYEFTYYLVERGRKEDFITGSFCAKCLSWCDIIYNAVQCVLCKHIYHRRCVDEPYVVDYSGVGQPSAFSGKKNPPFLALTNPSTDKFPKEATEMLKEVISSWKCPYCKDPTLPESRLLMDPNFSEIPVTRFNTSTRLIRLLVGPPPDTGEREEDNGGMAFFKEKNATTVNYSSDESLDTDAEVEPQNGNTNGDRNDDDDGDGDEDGDDDDDGDDNGDDDDDGDYNDDGDGDYNDGSIEEPRNDINQINKIEERHASTNDIVGTSALAAMGSTLMDSATSEVIVENPIPSSITEQVIHQPNNVPSSITEQVTHRPNNVPSIDIFTADQENKIEPEPINADSHALAPESSIITHDSTLGDISSTVDRIQSQVSSTFAQSSEDAALEEYSQNESIPKQEPVEVSTLGEISKETTNVQASMPIISPQNMISSSSSETEIASGSALLPQVSQPGDHISLSSNQLTPDVKSEIESNVASSSYPPSPSRLNGNASQNQNVDTHHEHFSPYPFIYLGAQADYASMLQYRDSQMVDLAYLPSIRIGTDYHADLSFLRDIDMSPTTEKVPAADEGEAQQTETPKEDINAPASQETNNNLEVAASDNVKEIQKSRTDEDIVFQIPNDTVREKIDEYVSVVQQMLPYAIRTADIRNTDRFVNKALETLHEEGYDFEKATNTMAKVKPIDVGIVAWSEREIKAFETMAEKHKDDLIPFRKAIPSKTMKDIVEFYYKWYPTRRASAVLQRYEENGRKELNNNASFLSSGGKHGKNANGAPNHNSRLSDDPIIFQQCVNCRTSHSPIWKIIEIDEVKETYCLECGGQWLKYGSMPKISEATKLANIKAAEEAAVKKPRKRMASVGSEISANEKISGPTAKKLRTTMEISSRFYAPTAYQTDAESESEDDELSTICAVCQCSNIAVKNGLGGLVSCKLCKMCVHPFCYGYTTDPKTEFTCHRCANETFPKYSLNYSCVLCKLPQTRRSSPLLYTLGSNWIHAACAIWIPGLTCANEDSVAPIAGFGQIPERCLGATCRICERSQGAKIVCDECDFACHVMCAQYASLELYVDFNNSRVGFRCPEHDKRQTIPPQFDVMQYRRINEVHGKHKCPITTYNYYEQKFPNYGQDVVITDPKAMVKFLRGKSSVFSKPLGIGEKKALSAKLTSIFTDT